ncbi:MAG TPA: ATP synthase F1 subunit epsilon [Fimbriimonadaceae bacterium]|nr:ATP synthase F1 subunit epsilon [Fimbriimonadaceae bacterium]
MANQINLSVVAPDRTVFEDMVDSVIVPGEMGYMGILKSHEPSIVALKTGVVEYIDGTGQCHYVSISGGFLEVGGESAIVLADTAERATEIDIARAERALEEARRTLRGEDTGVTSEEATAELERAINRINTAKKA